jgi:hypothetical protein
MFLSSIQTDRKTTKMSLISYLYWDLQCYLSERNLINLSELAPHQHRAHQGEKHIFFHNITSHISHATPYWSKAYSTCSHHIITVVPSCMVCEKVLISNLWFVCTFHALDWRLRQLFEPHNSAATLRGPLLSNHYPCHPSINLVPKLLTWFIATIQSPWLTPRRGDLHLPQISSLTIVRLAFCCQTSIGIANCQHWHTIISCEIFCSR